MSLFVFNLLEIKWFDVNNLSELLIRFLFNGFILFFVIIKLYHKQNKRNDFSFTYFILGNVVFFLCFLLESVNLNLGFALGLFAIFGILRYRTTPIPIREMTYLFAVIGISIINALTNKKIGYFDVFITNVLFLIILYFSEFFFREKIQNKKVLIMPYNEYEKITSILELKNELEQKIKLKIEHLKIGKINIKKDTVKIHIFFNQEQNNYFMNDNDND